MSTQMLAIRNAEWRSDAARLRSRHVCSTVTATSYGMKPAGNVSAFTAIDRPRRGAPPQ
jgi:hypothetical protein